ncbi:hypothetical protein [Arthrobacter sp. efr-133-TYG-118]|uniref:hypothetical protein n=1 Tax=Arthrobacter sp. efr-133-TYG-118 TaxID=3040279 RepID=UPI00254E30B5|nr:hypothetical protein [Arthrobacter sp. efr-133-TYG-118]
MSAMEMRELGSPEMSVPDPPNAEAVATSREPQHWGRAMAVAIGKLADQLASEDGHEALMGRELRLRITANPDGARISVWCLPEE